MRQSDFSPLGRPTLFSQCKASLNININRNSFLIDNDNDNNNKRIEKARVRETERMKSIGIYNSSAPLQFFHHFYRVPLFPACCWCGEKLEFICCYCALLCSLAGVTYPRYCCRCCCRLPLFLLAAYSASNPPPLLIWLAPATVYLVAP